jgi:DNA-binding XRE family transcriptional regulator
VGRLSDLQDFLDIALKDPKIKDASERSPEQDIMTAILSARTELGLTQKQLAELTGIQQANISRLETGNYNPSLSILKRVARGLGKKVRIEFD